MRELAAKAGVAPATPYNLLSTKTNLLTLVVMEEFETFRSKMKAIDDLTGLDHLLATIELLSVHYADDREFYFGFQAAAGTAGENSLGPILMQQGRNLFREMVASAVEEQKGEVQLDLDMITDILLRNMRATVEAWYVDGWSNSDFKAVFAYSARLILLPLLQGTAGERIRVELKALQAQFSEVFQHAS